jgi:hypothetical protein
MNRTAAPTLQIALPLEFAHRTLAAVLLAAEANLLLFLFRACLTFIPLRHILRAVTRNRDTAPPTRETPVPIRSIARALRVRWAVEAVTRNASASFVCLPQALAGYTMLRLRCVPTTMVYGVGSSPTPGSPSAAAPSLAAKAPRPSPPSTTGPEHGALPAQA